MKEHEDNFTTTTTTVTKTEHIDTETGKVMRTTTNEKKSSRYMSRPSYGFEQ